MSMIGKYNDFILEKEFNSIIGDFFRIIEDVDGKWTSPNTIEWDYSEIENKPNKPKDLYNNKTLDKLHKFLKKLPKDKIKEYYIKLVNKFKNLPDSIRINLISKITSIFLTFVTIGYLISPIESTLSKIGLSASQKKEIESLIKSKNNKASFTKAQSLVKAVEAGYSDDKEDEGNWIMSADGTRNFIGTNHGISAPILAKYLKERGVKRPIRQSDMINLSYDEALKIFKHNYWDKQKLFLLKDQNVANIIYDGCVNQGIGGMRKILKRAIEDYGIEVNNELVFSEKILKKINNLNQEEIFNSIKKYREQKYRESRTFKKHGRGWLNRLNSITYQ